MKLDFHPSSTYRHDLAEILHFLPYPFLVSDLRDGIRHNIFVNKQFVDEIGYTCEDIPTIDDWFRIAYPDPLYRNKIIGKWQESAKKALQDGSDHVLMRARIQTRNSGRVWYEVKASVTERNHLVAFINIDEMLRKEEQLNIQHENKNRTLSILSHDLRAPLTNLLSFSELARNSRLTEEEFHDTITAINKKTAQALDLLDTTLTWTRTNFETIHIKTENVLVWEILENIFVLYETAMKEKDLSVSYSNVDENCLKTDREILTIMIRNVISNAIKFTPPKGKINIHWESDEKYQSICVKDSGIGMTPEQVSNIKAGKIISRAGTQKEKGIGIGLRFCMELAHKISADFEFDSSPSGTCVRINFPVDKNTVQPENQ